MRGCRLGPGRFLGKVPNRMVCFSGTGMDLVQFGGTGLKAEQRTRKEGAIGVREASRDKKPALESEQLGLS